MADLNSTIVRGNLRVTDDENINGNLKVSGTITGGNITGHLTLNENGFNVNFRPNLLDYTTGFYYGTNGNEALTLAAKQNVTSIQFITGCDPTTLTYASWESLKPALQIKYNKVAINKVLGDGQSPSYELDVDGSMGATTIYEGGTSLANKYAPKSHTHKAAASASTATTLNTYSMNYSNGVLTITSGTTNVASTSHTHDVS